MQFDVKCFPISLSLGALKHNFRLCIFEIHLFLETRVVECYGKYGMNGIGGREEWGSSGTFVVFASSAIHGSLEIEKSDETCSP